MTTLSRKLRIVLVLAATVLATVPALVDQSTALKAFEGAVLTALAALGIVPLHLDVVDE